MDFKRIFHKEAYVSRMPGLIPYVSDGDGGGLAYVGEEGSEKTNWGRIPADICIDEYTSVKESYTLEGHRYIAYKTLKDRYYELKNELDRIFIYKRVQINGDPAWIADRESDFYEIGGTDYIPIPDILFSEAILKRNNGYIVVADEYIGLEKFICIDHSFVPDALETILLFHRITGIVPVPYDFYGINVSRFVFLYEIRDMIEKLGDYEKIKPGDEFKNHGGKEMADYLSSVENGEKSYEKVCSNFSDRDKRPWMFRMPLLSFKFNINQEINTLGLFSEGDRTEEYKAKNRTFYIESIEESRINEASKNNFDMDENGKVLPGKLKPFIDGASGDMVLLQFNGKRWDRCQKYNSYTTVDLPCQVKKLEDGNRIVLIKYDNGVKFNEIDMLSGNIREFVLRCKDGTMKYATINNGATVMNDIKIYRTAILPSALNKNNATITLPKEGADSSIYMFERDAYDYRELKFKAGEYGYYDGKERVWKLLDPYGEFNEYRDEDIVALNVGTESQYTLYSVSNSFVKIFYDNKLYTPEYVKLERPYKENIPVNVSKASILDREHNIHDIVFIGNFITKVEETDESVGITYRMASPFKYITGGIKYLHEGETPTSDLPDTGVEYYESRTIIKNTSGVFRIGGDDIMIFYDELKPSSGTSSVYNDSLKLKRDVVTAKVRYMNGSRVNGDGYSESSVIKKDIFMGVTDMVSIVNGISFNRGNAAAFENFFRLGETGSFSDLINYGNNYFNI